jgi:hypothetical protein
MSRGGWSAGHRGHILSDFQDHYFGASFAMYKQLSYVGKPRLGKPCVIKMEPRCLDKRRGPSREVFVGVLDLRHWIKAMNSAHLLQRECDYILLAFTLLRTSEPTQLGFTCLSKSVRPVTVIRRSRDSR